MQKQKVKESEESVTKWSDGNPEGCREQCLQVLGGKQSLGPQSVREHGDLVQCV